MRPAITIHSGSSILIRTRNSSMNFRISILFTIIIVISFFGCKRKLKPGDYMQYIKSESNGLVTKDSVDNLEFTLFYKPVEYSALLEQQSTEIDKSQYEKDIAELKDMQYFTFTIA